MEKLITAVAVIILLGACGNGRHTYKKYVHEDTTAKQLLQGIWLNMDDEDVAFRVEGDTIYYPDSISQPVYFQIVNDTIVLHGAQLTKYPIERQSANFLQFRNQGDEVVKLTKSENSEDRLAFTTRRSVILNQRQLIKRDTVVTFSNQRYHGYEQVNPTTYKVIKSTVNEDGFAVDNIYYDNIVNLTIYRGADRLYSSDFRKTDFAAFVPEGYLSQSILSDISFQKIDAEGLHYEAAVCIPDSPLSYIVSLTIGFDGQKKMRTAY